MDAADHGNSSTKMGCVLKVFSLIGLVLFFVGILQELEIITLCSTWIDSNWQIILCVLNWEIYYYSFFVLIGCLCAVKDYLWVWNKVTSVWYSVSVKTTVAIFIVFAIFYWIRAAVLTGAWKLLKLMPNIIECLTPFFSSCYIYLALSLFIYVNWDNIVSVLQRKKDTGDSQNVDENTSSLSEHDFEYKFMELEFRAFRSYCMNYKASGVYDDYVRYLNYITLFGVSVFMLTTWEIWQQSPPAETKDAKQWGEWFKLIPSALVSIASQLSAKGESKLLPQSFATRAQNHVNAGAQWSKLYRKAKLYRERVQYLKLDGEAMPFNEAEKIYVELLDMYQVASCHTVIEEKLYQQYNDAKIFLGKETMMREQLVLYRQRIKPVVNPAV